MSIQSIDELPFSQFDRQKADPCGVDESTCAIAVAGALVQPISFRIAISDFFK